MYGQNTILFCICGVHVHREIHNVCTGTRDKANMENNRLSWYAAWTMQPLTSLYTWAQITIYLTHLGWRTLVWKCNQNNYDWLTESPTAYALNIRACRWAESQWYSFCIVKHNTEVEPGSHRLVTEVISVKMVLDKFLMLLYLHGRRKTARKVRRVHDNIQELSWQESSLDNHQWGCIRVLKRCVVSNIFSLKVWKLTTNQVLLCSLGCREYSYRVDQKNQDRSYRFRMSAKPTTTMSESASDIQLYKSTYTQ
jgi:hypothetical protein